MQLSNVLNKSNALNMNRRNGNSIWHMIKKSKNSLKIPIIHK